jgi:hypothetical protein
MSPQSAPAATQVACAPWLTQQPPSSQALPAQQASPLAPHSAELPPVDAALPPEPEPETAALPPPLVVPADVVPVPPLGVPPLLGESLDELPQPAAKKPALEASSAPSATVRSRLRGFVALSADFMGVSLPRFDVRVGGARSATIRRAGLVRPSVTSGRAEQARALTMKSGCCSSSPVSAPASSFT